MLAVLKAHEGLKEGSAVLLTDFSDVAVAVRNAAQSLSASAGEINEAIARVVSDVRGDIDAGTVVLDVDNMADHNSEREEREARRAHVSGL